MIKTCKNCGKTYETSDKRGKYCNRSCYLSTISGSGNPCWRGGKKELNCLSCGSVFYVRENRIKDGRGKFCSSKCYWKDKKGRLKPNWTPGKKYITKGGYVAVITERRSFTLEHRLVMEKHLGRKLLSSELVHHIDGDKTNNSIHNLELTNRSKHISEKHPNSGGRIVTEETREKIRQTLLIYNRNRKLLMCKDNK